MDPDFIEAIESSLDSVWTLELLLVLYADPEKGWTTSDLVAELRSSELIVKQSVAFLTGVGLAIEDNDARVKFRPVARDLEVFVERLEREYRARPSAVRRLIVGRANSKLQSFSDAFLLRKPK